MVIKFSYNFYNYLKTKTKKLNPLSFLNSRNRVGGGKILFTEWLNHKLKLYSNFLNNSLIGCLEKVETIRLT
jgi:hypothetical protein